VHDHVIAIRKTGAAVRCLREADSTFHDRLQQRIAVCQFCEPADGFIEDARLRELAFEADLSAVAVPCDGNERQVKDSARDPAEDPDHDDTVIEDCEQRRGAGRAR